MQFQYISPTTGYFQIHNTRSPRFSVVFVCHVDRAHSFCCFASFCAKLLSLPTPTSSSLRCQLPHGQQTNRQCSNNTTQATTTALKTKQLQLLLVAVVALLVFCGFHFFSYSHLFYLQFWTFLASPLRPAPQPRESATRRAHFICYCCFIYLLLCLSVFVCLCLCFCEQCNDLELRLLCIFFRVVVVLFLHLPAGIYYWSGLVGQSS